MFYFILPDCCIAFNAKVASTALAFSIVHKYYPERLVDTLERHRKNTEGLSAEFIKTLPESIQKSIYNDKCDSVAFWQSVCLTKPNPNPPILLLVREPVDRFVSAVAHLQIDPEVTISALESNGKMVFQKLPRNARNDTHLLPQHIYNGPDTKLYKFPDDLEKLCRDANLDWPLPRVNEGKYTKPVLTEEQIKRVEAYYAEDMKIWNSMNG